MSNLNYEYLIKISAAKRLIAINRIQNKRFCLHNIYVCTVYIYYVYINTHTFKKKFIYSVILFTFYFILLIWFILEDGMFGWMDGWMDGWMKCT